MLGHPFEQFARIKEAIERRQRAHFGLRDAAQDVLGAQLARMLQARRAEQVAQRLDGVLVELEHARGLVRGVELAPALRVLGGDAGGATVGVAAQRLDAAEREHEAARGVAPVRAHRHGAGRSEEHPSELQSLMRISYAVFCLKKKKKIYYINQTLTTTHIHH